MKINTLFFTIALLYTGIGYGQVKYEKEYRLKEKDVPENAREFLAAIKHTSKIKWYKEEGINKTSIEAKTKINQKKYSIEFDSTGRIEDVEVEIGWNEVPPATQTTIMQYLTDTHQQIKRGKIQMQFTGDERTLLNLLNKDSSAKKPDIHYEIIVKAKTGNKQQMLEYLFDQQGKMVSKSVIVFRNTDNLEY